MEVDKNNFRLRLHPWLQQLSTSCFVAIDLELSGIPSKSARDSSKQTLQQRYEEAKQAAEKYQVLQIGFTIIQEDMETCTYIALPSNVLVSPLLEERLGIQRDFSFQSEAVTFLMNHGFRMDDPFRKGVPYLSRDEAEAATKARAASLNRTFTDIRLEPHEIQSIQFVQKAREAIIRWERLTSRSEFLNIGCDSLNVTESTGTGLNNYQKRLIHQLVRTDFPKLRSTSRADFIQIVPYDGDTEKAILKARTETFEERLRRQTGLRYFVEGMVGGERLELIDSKVDPLNVDGRPAWIDTEKVKRDFEALRKSLRVHKTVLVGHNLFLDLINFYRCFFGTLPDTVEEFQTKIHELFPLVIDTKYMASALHEGPLVRSGLDELDAALGKMKQPIIILDKGHLRYEHNRYPHEAGFDSYITAKLLIRLTARLAARAIWAQDPDMEEYLPEQEEPLSENLDTAVPSLGPGNQAPVVTYADMPVDLLAPVGEEQSPSKTKNRRKRKKKAKGKDKIISAFATSNIFEVLDDDNEGDEVTDENRRPTDSSSPITEGNTSSEQGKPSKRHRSVWTDIVALRQRAEERRSYTMGQEEGQPLVARAGNIMGHEQQGIGHIREQVYTHHYRIPQAGAQGGDDPFYVEAGDEKAALPLQEGDAAFRLSEEEEVPPLMPHWDSDFWKEYGNKLTVNGTEEGVCYLWKEEEVG